ncbi:MAG: MATE family efflux transporter [Bariatricus sp.]|nr:MATE family efflux transporter [Bariatricus sp.]
MSQVSSSTRMTDGPIWKRIVLFAIPLFWGHLFQQCYNAADTLIVGNFLGSNALAAVSSSGSLIQLLVGLFNGTSIGASVVIGKYFGAGNGKALKRALHTTISFGLCCGIAVTMIGEIAAPQILRLMGTPEEVLVNSLVYFRIYFLGSIGFVMYNFFMGILQALGDSRHPLIYLIISSVTNVVLDLILIAGLGFGVGAAAFATTISQFLSAFLCLRQLLHNPEEIRVSIRDIRMDPVMLPQIVSNGLPTGIQNSIISLANVFVQSNINKFGALAVAGCGSYAKIEGFGFLPVTCFSMALTTFISQNLGARQYDRAKKGSVFGLICSITLAEFIGFLVYCFSPNLLALFGGSKEAIAFGITQARTISLFYCLLAYSHCMAGILRGAGRSTVPMLVMMICWCVIRVSYITIAIHFIPKINMVFWAYPITWTLSSIVFTIYYLKSDWIHGLEKQKYTE